MSSFTHRYGFLVALSGAGYVLSFCSQLVISYQFGTSPVLDAYWAGLALVNVLCFYLHPLREALVPAIHRANQDSPENAGRIISAGLSLLGMFVIVSSLLLWTFSERFSTLMTQVGDLRSGEEIVRLIPWLIPYMGVFALSEALSAVLISFDRAILQSLVRLAGAVVFLGVLVSIGTRMGVSALVLGQVASMVVVVVLCATALRAFSMRPIRSALRVLREGEVFPLFLSLLGSFLFAQLYVLGERAAMIYLSGGLVSAFQYSTSLVNVLVSLLAYPLANLLWPRFLASGQADDPSGAGVLAARAAAVLFLALLVACTFVLMRAEKIVVLLFSRGAFGVESIAQTTTALQATILTAIPIGVLAILGRLLISLRGNYYPVAISLATTLVGMTVIGTALFSRSTALVQWHWFAANLAGLAVSIIAYSRECHLSSRQLLAGLIWVGLSLLAVSTAAALTPTIGLSGGKVYVAATLLMEALIFASISAGVAWMCGVMRPLLVLLRPAN